MSLLLIFCCCATVFRVIFFSKLWSQTGLENQCFVLICAILSYIPKLLYETPHLCLSHSRYTGYSMFSLRGAVFLPGYDLRLNVVFSITLFPHLTKHLVPPPALSPAVLHFISSHPHTIQPSTMALSRAWESCTGGCPDLNPPPRHPVRTL